jgi:hypothetical protein
MTVRDWLANQRSQLERRPATTVVASAAQELWQGALRRTLGQAVSGTSIWERQREWDILCVLDGCRADLMHEVCEENAYDWLPDPTASGYDTLSSVGTTSTEWISRTFAPEFRDSATRTAYVTANMFTDAKNPRDEPWPNLPLDGGAVGFLHEVWKTTDSAPIDGVSSVAPEDMTAYAVRTWRAMQSGELDVDKLVVHYMQPHAPFRTHPEWNAGDDNVWKRYRDGLLGSDEVWTAYRDNLDWVLDSIADLRENVDGKLVLTADHGNGMGEWGVYAHPPETPSPAVRNVPWVSVPTDDLQTMDPDVPVQPERTNEATTDRLRNLGYV